MTKIDRDRPRFRREHKEIEPIAGGAPASATSFATVAAARERDARNKAELSRIAADFIARGGKPRK